MARTIRIAAGKVEVTATLNDTATADAIWAALPLDGYIHTWGEEVYFSIDLHLPLDDPHEVVDMGDLGYWPQGPAFCIFFGPTPMSRGNDIRPASAVNVFGKVTGDPRVFTHVPSGAQIQVHQAGVD
jgi:hypothetical protein